MLQREQEKEEEKVNGFPKEIIREQGFNILLNNNRHDNYFQLDYSL